MKADLSKREREIVVLVVEQSMTYAEVGEELGISHHTVRSYAEVIGRKLGGSPRRAMARYYWTEVYDDTEAA